MPDNSPLPAPSIEETRADVGRILSDHFAEDRISVEEFERRLELTFKASTVDAVRAQLAGLADASAGAVEPISGSDRAQPVEFKPRSRSKTYVAFMSGIARRGTWTVPGTLNVIAFMGGAELDLRQARLGPGVTNIHVFTVMGGVEITVPPKVRVEVDGMAIMGAFEDRVEYPDLAYPDAPFVRVTGFAFMGGVEVRVKVGKPRLGE